jgi:hypothetical protein
MKLTPPEKPHHARGNSDTPEGEADDSRDLDMPPNESDKLLPLRSVLTKPVVVTVINHTMFALLNGVAVTYIPLVWSTPVEFGGLNLSPASIGLWLSVYGGVNGIFQFLFFPHLIRRFGPRHVFVSSIVACAVIYAIFPFENLALRIAGGGSSLVLWLLIILQLSSLGVSVMGYGKFFAPNTLAYSGAHIHVGSLSYCVLIHFICCSQQTVARRGEWSFAGGDFNSERCWTGCCGLAVCVLPDA